MVVQKIAQILDTNNSSRKIVGLAVFCKPVETVSVMENLDAQTEIKLIQLLSSILMMWFSPD